MTNRVVDGAVTALAATQEGLVLRHQAQALGASSSLIDRRLAAGRWSRAADDVYDVGHFPPSWRRSLFLLQLSSGGAVSHQAAAALHGFRDRPRAPLVVTVAHGRWRWSAVPGRVWQSTLLPDDHLTTVDGLRATRPARTLVDLAGREDRSLVQRTVESAVVDRHTSLAEIDRVFRRLAVPGRPGIAVFVTVLDDLAHGAVPSESVMEERFLHICATHGIPRPLAQAPLPGRERARSRTDFRDAEYPILYECDSRRWHARLEDFERDRRRDRAAQLHGHAVHRFTWAELADAPGEVAATVHEARAVAARRRSA